MKSRIKSLISYYSVLESKIQGNHLKELKLSLLPGLPRVKKKSVTGDCQVIEFALT